MGGEKGGEKEGDKGVEKGGAGSTATPHHAGGVTCMSPLAKVGTGAQVGGIMLTGFIGLTHYQVTRHRPAK